MTDEQRDSLLEKLHNELENKKYILETLRDEIKSQDISKYPIFVASKDFLNLGKLALAREDENNWNFYVSHLEEFAHKGIVAMDKTDAFRDVYKQHINDLCIFIVEQEQGDFVFLP